ncbi:MAG: GDP-mannose 4,6-dehydratase [Gemmatimonadaceae bacterium]|nr:GDP-mannose 4,6-dehydratase [Gemmatimonadaceae bacterium]
MTTALITGVTGQDGRYLADALVTRGYRVVGVARRVPRDPLPPQVDLRSMDVSDEQALTALLQEARPDEIYHLAAETSVERSWDDPASARASAQAGVTGLLEQARCWAPASRIFVATSSEIFSGATETPQDEQTPLAPGSPYGEGKAAVLAAVRRARAEFGQHVSAGILYTHESPRRPPRFLARKVTQAVASIAAGRARELRLGNLEARRDWGFAGDYVDAMWRMLQAPSPDDYVIGTGVTRRVVELCDVAFGRVGLDYREYVVSDPTLFRPVDSATLVANPARARRQLGWAATTSFEDMIGAMVDADLRGGAELGST